jgi:probable RNA-binding protein EIF1AD
MPKPRRNLQATAEETTTPPQTLTAHQSVARVLQAAGNNLYRVTLPNSTKIYLVELPARFRSAIWIKRGGYVLVDLQAMTRRENKLDGEIVNVVRNEKEWRKEKYWPEEFGVRAAYVVDEDEDDDEDESRVGKMPPSDSEEEE